MAQGPPSSDSESDDDVCRYQYESEGEERLGASACNLLNEAGGDYRRKFPRPYNACAYLTSTFSRTSFAAGIH